MKLRYYKEKGKKVYTLKEEHKGESTKDAHYKFRVFCSSDKRARP